MYCCVLSYCMSWSVPTKSTEFLAVLYRHHYFSHQAALIVFAVGLGKESRQFLARRHGRARAAYGGSGTTPRQSPGQLGAEVSPAADAGRTRQDSKEKRAKAWQQGSGCTLIAFDKCSRLFSVWSFHLASWQTSQKSGHQTRIIIMETPESSRWSCQSASIANIWLISWPVALLCSCCFSC